MIVFVEYIFKNKLLLLFYINSMQNEQFCLVVLKSIVVLIKILNIQFIQTLII